MKKINFTLFFFCLISLFILIFFFPKSEQKVESFICTQPSNYSFVSNYKKNTQLTVPFFTNDINSELLDKDTILDSNIKFNNHIIPCEILKIQIDENPQIFNNNLRGVYQGSLTFSFPSFLNEESINTSLELEGKTQKASLFLGDISFEISNNKNDHSDIEYALLNCVYSYDDNASFLSAIILDISTKSTININELNLGISQYGFKNNSIKLFTGDKRTELIKAFESGNLDKVIKDTHIKNINSNTSYEIDTFHLEKGEYSIYIPIEHKNKNTLNCSYLSGNLTYQVNNNTKNIVIFPFKSMSQSLFSEDEVTKAIKRSNYDKFQ